MSISSQRQCDIINKVNPNTLGAKLAYALPEEVRIPMGEDMAGCYHINSEYVPLIAECCQAVIAEVVSSLINAGSERDAVMENEALAKAIEAELMDWSERA